jgi:hypothetical protein
MYTRVRPAQNPQLRALCRSHWTKHLRPIVFTIVEPDICLSMVSFSGMWTCRLNASRFLSLPREHPVGKQNRQAIVEGCEVVEQFDFHALE